MCTMGCWAAVAGAQQSTRSAPSPSPGDPSTSTLGDAPGASATGALGNAPAGGQGVIGTGPGPGFPRVPQGITRPSQPFGPPSGPGIEPVPRLPDAELPLYGRLEAPSGGSPAGPPGGLTLDEAIDRVLRVNLDLRAKAMEIPKAQADILTAGLWANPLLFMDAQMVPYGSFDGTGGGPTQYDVNITHPIDLNGKWKRRTEVAVRAKEVIEAQYQDAVRLQVDNLYTAWIDVLATRETIRYLEASLESLADLLGATQALREQGSAIPSDVNRIEILRDSTELALMETQETLVDANRTLATILYLPPDVAERLEIRGELRGPDIPAPPREELIRVAMETRPDLAAFRLGTLRARAEVNLARANRFEDVFLLYQPYTHQAPLEAGDNSSTSWAVGLTIPLPIYNRNQGNIAKARHTVTQTQIQLADVERRVLVDVQRAERAYAVTTAAVRRLEGEIVPAARENLETSLVLYRSGERDQLSYLEAQRAFNEISRQYRDALVRHRRAMLRLNTVVGRRLFP
jgi:cobalt-zinc-cadmium efflux system outer membrane protein